MEAITTIISIIKTRVEVMNMDAEDFGTTGSSELIRQWEQQVYGMLTCLRNINDTDRFYCFDIYNDHYDFGYFEDDIWVSLVH